MGFGRLNWPRSRRLFSVAEMPALRAVGHSLWPEAEPLCCDLSPLPKELDSLPGVIQEAVKRGVQTALRDMPPVTSTPAPHNAPPFRNTPINTMIALLIGASPSIAALGSINNALQNTAPQVSGALFPIVEEAVGTFLAEMAPFLTLKAGVYERLHISGVDYAVSSLDAILTLAFTVTVDGLTVLDRVRLPALRKFSLDVAPGSVVVFFVQNADNASAFLVYFTALGWSYPCEGQGNYESASVLRQDGQWDEPNAACVPRRGQTKGPCP